MVNYLTSVLKCTYLYVKDTNKDQNNILGIVYLMSPIKLLWKPVIGLCEVCNFAEYLINMYCIKYK